MNSYEPKEVCFYCHKSLEGPYVTVTVAGVSQKAHTACFHINNPPRVCHTFEEVIGLAEDKLLIQRLLSDIVSQQAKAEIVERYNKEIVDRHIWKITQ